MVNNVEAQFPNLRCRQAVEIQLTCSPRTAVASKGFSASNWLLLRRMFFGKTHPTRHGITWIELLSCSIPLEPERLAVCFPSWGRVINTETGSPLPHSG